jgi:HEAT repeat protein
VRLLLITMSLVFSAPAVRAAPDRDPLPPPPDIVRRLQQIETSPSRDPEDLLSLRDRYRDLLGETTPGSAAHGAVSARIAEVEKSLPDAYAVLRDGPRAGLSRQDQVRLAAGLGPHLRHASPAVRLGAVEYLRRLASEAGVHALGNALRTESDRRVADAMLAALVDIGGEKVSRLLWRDYGHLDDEPLVLRIQGALVQLAGRPGDGAHASKALGRFVGHPSERVAAVALRHLTRLGRLGAPGLMEGALLPRRFHDRKLECIALLGTAGVGESADVLGRFLIFGAKDLQHELKIAAVAALIRIGRPAVPHLIRFVDHPRCKQWTKYVLWRITGAGGLEYPEQVRSWWDRHKLPEARRPENRRRPVEPADTPDSERPEALLARAEAYAERYPEDAVGLRDLYLELVARLPADSRHRRMVVSVLEAIESILPRAYVVLRDGVTPRPSFSDLEAGKMAFELRPHLAHDHPRVRAHAATYLGRLGREEDVYGLVTRLSREEDSAVVTAILGALEAIGGEKVPELLGRYGVRRATEEVRFRTIAFLAALARRDGPGGVIASEQLGSVVRGRVDPAAVAALESLERLGPAGVPGLGIASRTKHPVLLLRVVRALGASRNGEAAATLGRFLGFAAKGEALKLRAEAIRGLETLGHDGLRALAPHLDVPRTRAWTRHVVLLITGREFANRASLEAWLDRVSGD